MPDVFFMSFIKPSAANKLPKSLAMQTERAKSIVELDGKQAEQMLDLLKAKAQNLRSEMNKAFAANDLEGFKKNQAELASVERSMKGFKKASFDVDSVLKNLNGSTLKDLQKAQTAITNQLRGMTRGTEEYINKTKELQTVRNEISTVKAEMNGFSASGEGFLARINSFIGKWGNLITGFAATLAGLTLSLNKFKDYALDIEDAKANLSSLTGLKGDDLEDMGAKAEKMSTTTTEAGVRITKSAKDILDAFTLMGSAKPELLKDKEALAQVTKEGLTLAEAAKMEAKPAIESLATVMNQFSLGSDQATRTINVLAAGSQAGAEEVDGLAESIKNFGPAAKGANVSLEESVALVEALSEKGLKGAESGTGIRNFLLTLQSGANDTNPKLVGLEKALENLAAKNMSASEMVKRFGKENYVTASLVIENRNRVSELTKAVTGTNTAYEQAKINTDTTRAKLAQASNQFMLQAKVVGEKLGPALAGVTNIGTKFLKLLIEFPSAITTLLPAVAGLGAAWLVYNASVVTSTASTKLMLLWNNLVVGSLNKLRLALATNPATVWLAALGALTSVGIGLYRSLKNLNEIGSEFIKRVTQEKIALDNAFSALKSTTQGTEERRMAIKLINDKYGELLPNMLKESATLKEIEAAQDAATRALIRNIAAKSKQEELEKVISEKSSDIEEKTKRLYDRAVAEKGEVAAELVMKRVSEIAERYKGTYTASYRQIMQELNQATREFGRSVFFDAKDIVYFRSEIETQTKQIETFYQRYLRMLGIKDQAQQQAKPEPTPDEKVATSGVGAGSSRSDDRYNREKEALERWFREKQNLYKRQYLQEKTDRSQFDADMYSLELTRLMKLKAIEKRYGKDISDVEGQYLDRRISFREKANDMVINAQKEADSFLAEITKEGYDGLENLLKEHHKDMQKRIDDNYDEIDKNEEYEKKERDEKAKSDFEGKKQQYEQFKQLSDDFAQSFGNLMADFITDQEMTQEEFANALLLIGLDTLHNVVRMAIAQIWAHALASPENWATFGAIGVAKATSMSLLVETAFAVAKSLVRRPTAQREKGKYDVLATDGNTYSAQIIENPGTGIYSTPTLFAEKGSELIVDNQTLNRIMGKSPWVLDEIMRLRVPQRAEGKYDSIPATPPLQNGSRALTDALDRQQQYIEKLISVLEKPIEAKLLSSNARSVLEREDQIRGRARRR